MIQLPEPAYELYTQWLTNATMKAIQHWLDTITPQVFTPAVTASTTTEPDLTVVLTSTRVWDEALQEYVDPITGLIIAHRLDEIDQDRGLYPSPDYRTNPTPEDQILLKDIHKAAKQTATNIPTLQTILTTPTWQDIITTTAGTSPNLTAGFTETIYRDLIEKIAKSTHDGADLWQRTTMVRQYLSMKKEGGYTEWMRHAETISRTETTRLINTADLEAIKQEAQQTGEELEKAWVAGIDNRTRDTHYAADGQRVPLDGKFRIGGYDASMPGDHNLPAAEAINCRCTLIYLEKDEPLPKETYRLTPTTTTNPEQQITTRKKRGVTRTRDTETAAHSEHCPCPQHHNQGETTMRRQFTANLAPIGEESGDGRIINSNATISMRDFPLPLMWQKSNGVGHDTAVIIGKITAATVSNNTIQAVGELFDSPEAQEAAALIEEGVIRPSVDLCDTVAEYKEQDDLVIISECKLMAATLVAKPAFNNTSITLGKEISTEDNNDTATLTASVATLTPTQFDKAAFDNPKLTTPTGLTVEHTTGHVYGHLALWGTEHVGMPGQRITPPHSSTGYALFHVSSVETKEGPLPVGRLTVGCGHADTRDSMGDAVAHYDNAGTCWAYVRAGEDEHGIWVSGVINPDADQKTVTAGAAAPLSGDWRRVGGSLELVAALSVNTPGFPVPRSYSTMPEQTMSLVASGVVSPDEQLEAKLFRALDRYYEQREGTIAQQQRAQRARELSAHYLNLMIGA